MSVVSLEDNLGEIFSTLLAIYAAEKRRLRIPCHRVNKSHFVLYKVR